jgi:hypothetical protein
VDIVTHGLASLAVARGLFPRAGKLVMAGAVVAGTIADVDWLSKYFGPSAFLTWHGTYLHSIVVVFFFLAAIPSAHIPWFISAENRGSFLHNPRSREL